MPVFNAVLVAPGGPEVHTAYAKTPVNGVIAENVKEGLFLVTDFLDGSNYHVLAVYNGEQNASLGYGSVFSLTVSGGVVEYNLTGSATLPRLYYFYY